MPKDVYNEAHIESFKSYVKMSAFWRPRFNQALDLMTGDELDRLVSQLFLAQKGGGIKVNGDFTSMVLVDRVSPKGKIQFNKHHTGLVYTGVPYRMEFSGNLGGVDAPSLHLISMHGRSPLAVESVRWSRHKSEYNDQLLVCRTVNDRRTSVAYERVDDKHLKLTSVGIDYGYLSGVYKSAPSGFVPPTRAATYLDAMIVKSDGQAQFQFNIGKTEFIKDGGDGWFHIKDGDHSKLVKVKTQLESGMLEFQITDGHTSKSDGGEINQWTYPPVTVPLEAKLPIDFANLTLPNNPENDQVFIGSIDSFTRRLSSIAPKAKSS